MGKGVRGHDGYPPRYGIRAATDGAPAAGARAFGGAILRVLIVDDNRVAADSLAKLLARRGHETRPVYGGSDALAAVDELRPQVIVLDIGLPDIDGREVARRVRAHHGSEEILLVAITGFVDERLKSDAENAGCDAFMRKPFDLQQLYSLIDAGPRTPAS